MRRCIADCREGECTCPAILSTTSPTGQPVVRCVDGFVHVHIGVLEFVLTANLAEEFGLAVLGNAGLARKGFNTAE